MLEWKCLFQFHRLSLKKKKQTTKRTPNLESRTLFSLPVILHTAHTESTHAHK